jgi:hypothetical protein
MASANNTKFTFLLPGGTGEINSSIQNTFSVKLYYSMFKAGKKSFPLTFSLLIFVLPALKKSS